MLTKSPTSQALLTQSHHSISRYVHPQLRPMVQVLCIVLALAAGTTGRGEDWVQWAGNDGQGNWRETGIVNKFPAGGLKPSWVTPIGSGYAGPIVADGKIYVTGYLPKKQTKTLEAIEQMVCLDEETGKVIWSQQWETHYRRQMRSYATGPRATPVIHDGRVFCIGATGRIFCFDAKSGAIRWSYDALEDFKASVPIWAMSASPIIWKDSVIFVCGGSDGYLRAFDQASGKPKWKSLPLNGDMPYCTPTVMKLAGTTQLIQWDARALNSVNPDTGKLNWQVPFPIKANMGLARPVQVDNKILLSCFYNGSMLIEVSSAGGKVVWKNGGTGERPRQTKSLHSVITTPIVSGQQFYGTCSYGELRGLRLQDGERLWESKKYTRQGRWGSFFWVKNGDRYFVNNDLGELLIMKFSPTGPQLIDRAQLIKPDTHCGFGGRRFADALVNWVHPAYANGHVVIRNDAVIQRISLLKK